jgi:hypothetical protein
MSLLGHPDFRALGSVWRRTLVWFAVCSLAVSLATRYAAAASEFQTSNCVKCQSLEAKRQHLLGDGLQWTAPTVALMMFLSPRSAAPALPATFPLINLYSQDWLYNRPPPCY